MISLVEDVPDSKYRLSINENEIAIRDKDKGEAYELVLSPKEWEQLTQRVDRLWDKFHRDPN